MGLFQYSAIAIDYFIAVYQMLHKLYMFYKFGDLMFLNKISTPYLVGFFNSRFADTGKSINEDAVNLIVELVDNHPYYA